MEFKVKFWGVRGSIACPSPSHVVYGGNTSCVSIEIDGDLIILDAGTGIRPLGQDLLRRQMPSRAVLLLTHTHWDHINGFPFFAPAFQSDYCFHIMAGHLGPVGGVQMVLASQMSNPMFPVPLDAMRAKLTFEDFSAGDSFRLYDRVVVRTAPLNHPNGATGYRIEANGRSVCYVTDTEHVPGQPDENVLGLIRDADLVIYDSTYTDDEFPAKKGWGHSTWQEAIRLCRDAGVRKLAIFHHDPDHDDAFMARLEAEAIVMWPGAFAAREGMELELVNGELLKDSVAGHEV